MSHKTAVITGGSEGLGRHIALKLSREGIATILLARNQDNLQKVVAEIQDFGGAADYFTCDITHPHQVSITTNEILKKYPNIDILVSNAGVYYATATEKMPSEQVRHMFEVNTLGSINIIQAFLPHFKKQNNGQILSVVSIAGIEPSGEWGMYAASKFAQTGFMESLRKELEHTKIKIMGFYPEGIDTQIFQKGGLPIKPHQPWMMNPSDVAEIIYFMLSRPNDVSLSQVVARKIPDERAM
jgi:short-subunit dehydrogenase